MDIDVADTFFFSRVIFQETWDYTALLQMLGQVFFSEIMNIPSSRFGMSGEWISLSDTNGAG